MDEQMIAEIVHDAMVWAAKIRGEPRKWCNGNSFAEDRAREAASEIASVIAGKVAELESALRNIASQACCYGMSAGEDELRDWIKAISDEAEAALAPHPKARND